MDTIKSGKMTILEIFKDNWFNISDYQRQYSWNEELVETLLDDIKEAMNYPDKEYFLGSFVFIHIKITKKNGNYLTDNKELLQLS